jgi:hypothetical protein
MYRTPTSTFKPQASTPHLHGVIRPPMTISGTSKDAYIEYCSRGSQAPAEHTPMQLSPIYTSRGVRPSAEATAEAKPRIVDPSASP